MDTALLGTLSLALGLGLLIGLQRERSGSRLGGIRTFPLIALLGAVCGLLGREWGGIIVAAGFLGVVALAALANFEKARSQQDTVGQTTEAAALLTYVLGAFLATENYAVAVVVGGVAAVLLQFKQPMHEFAGGMSERDVRAVMRFVIVSLIILPILPNKAYGPYLVLNPTEIWLMVVLIVGMGMTGYAAYRFFRGQTSVLVGGIIGGLVSSTATTVACARRVAGSAEAGVAMALIISIAWLVAVVRVIIEVVVVAGAAWPQMVPPLVALLIVMVLATLALYYRGRREVGEVPPQDNPAELHSALLFGGLYALVLFVAAWAKNYFGADALYAVALVSGMVDVDAITLSTAQLVSAGRVDAQTGWKVVMVASLSNLVFKTGAVLLLGSWRLFLLILPAPAAGLIAGVLILWAWPGGPG